MYVADVVISNYCVDMLQSFICGTSRLRQIKYCDFFPSWVTTIGDSVFSKANIFVPDVFPLICAFPSGLFPDVSLQVIADVRELMILLLLLNLTAVV